MRRSTLAIVSLLALGLALVVAGCGGTKSSSSSGGSTEDGGETANASECTPSQMDTHKEGVLTVATDKPAYPPYFENDEPENGEGFESAVAYAIGKQLGYPEAKVEWTVEPFDSSYAPGPKNFDFDINEISITPAREKAVDFSAPYYSAQQAVVALEDSEAAKAESLAELKDVKFGVQINTTSLSAVDEVIEPSSKPEVFNSSGDVITALKNGQVEAVVVDLPTALEVIAIQVENAKVVGQFGKAEGEEWGALLAKESSLTQCISGAIEALEESGELEKITQRWMSQAAEAPQLH
ncbi:MAG TPA: ABC transporter substrate-binding protein [Solirubrobacterales bacterium]|jgi:polar amino acid transport system substrate-binding protein|nr:ABC transporter substrate-binding protein [Solirubrobacterales bacterium]